MSSAQVAILIVAYNARQDIEDCLTSVFSSAADSLDLHIVLVDNNSSDGTADFVAASFADVHLVRSDTNLGFAGGNNVGWEYIRKHWPDLDYLVLLNSDTLAEANWLTALCRLMQDRPEVGIAQAKLRLYPEISKLNSAGNSNHYLGFGFVTALGQEDLGQYDRIRYIHFASGAACIIRADLIRRLGFFESDLFLYLEDTDLSWKIRQFGYQACFVPESLVYHKYSFQKNYSFYYYFERNRYWLLFTYYRLPTLLLLSPALLFMEAGQWLFALQQGVFLQKLRAAAFFLNPSNLRKVWTRRRTMQSQRRISDRIFTQTYLGKIEFPFLTSPLLKLANLFLDAYWKVIRNFLFW